MKLIKVGVACTNQTPLAWDENFAHLRQAIEHARAEGVTLVCLPELAITGYGCEDTFHMDGVQDMYAFAQLDMLAPHTKGMAVTVGLPVYHEKALYNLRGAARRRSHHRLRRQAVPRRRRHPLRAAVVQAVAGR